MATGQSDQFTTFYQVAGFGLMDGMLLQQRNDFGIGVSGHYAVMGEIGGISLKVEANLGVLASRFMNADLGATQLKIYGVFGNDNNKEYTLPGTGELTGNYNDFSFGRFQAGLSKGWYFGKNFSFTPFVGYGMESASSEQWSEFAVDADSASIGTDFIHLGAYGTMNVFHWMQLMATVNIYNPIGEAYKNDRADTYGMKYTEVFDKRKGLSVELGVRIEF